MNNDVYLILYIIRDLQLKTSFLKKLTKTVLRINFIMGEHFLESTSGKHINDTTTFLPLMHNVPKWSDTIKNHTANDVNF